MQGVTWECKGMPQTGAWDWVETPKKYDGGVMFRYTKIIRSGSANATREAFDPIEK